MKIVAISGPSCSGKSTISQNLLRLVPGSIILHQDDFYLPDSEIPETRGGVANWDCPEAFDMEGFAAAVAELRAGNRPRHKTYEKTEVEEIDAEDPGLEPMAIVEGIMLYQRGSPLLAQFDTKLFVYENKATLRERRRTRTYDTLEGSWADPPGYFDEVVWPEFEKNYGYLLDKEGCPSAAAAELGIEFIAPGPLPQMFEAVVGLVGDARI